MRNLAAVAVGDQAPQRDLADRCGCCSTDSRCRAASPRRSRSRNSASSMPTEPNSLTISAVPRPSGVCRKRRTRVVLPAPRKPVTIVTGSRDPRARFCRRPKRPADCEGKRSRTESLMVRPERGSPLPACGERSTAEGGRVRGTCDRATLSKLPLTPTLSPQAGRGSHRMCGEVIVKNPSPGSTARRCGGRRSTPPRVHRRIRR